MVMQVKYLIQEIFVSFLDKYTSTVMNSHHRLSGTIIEAQVCLQFEACFRVVMNNLTWLANSLCDYTVVLNLLDWLIDRFASDV